VARELLVAYLLDQQHSFSAGEDHQWRAGNVALFDESSNLLKQKK